MTSTWASYASAALGGDVTCRVHEVGPRPRHVVCCWHGRGGSARDWDAVVPGVAALVADGALPPVLLVAPEAPWSGGGHWYVDSTFTASPRGRPVETTLVVDLVAAVEARHGVEPARTHRVVAGVSMGAAGALRHLVAHPDVFGAAVALAPPTWWPQPPAESSARVHGAFGIGSDRFVAERWRALSPRRVVPAGPVRAALAVGADDDLPPVTRATLDDLVAAGVEATLAVVPGGHGFDAWAPAFARGLVTVLA